MRFARLLALLLVPFLASGAAQAASAGPVTVFAAASLTDALTEVAADYEAKTGAKIALSFAGSPVLAKQIDASGGADIFISADAAWMDYLAQRGRIETGSRTNLLGNRLVLIAPRESTGEIRIAPGFALVRALHGGRLAVADPETVPAGRYAREALTALGVWNSVADYLAPAENVRVALAYVARGEAPLGIVYSTDAKIEPAVRIVGAFPAASHAAIVYPVGLIKGARPGSAAFLAFLSRPAARHRFEKAGFSVFPPAAKP